MERQAREFTGEAVLDVDAEMQQEAAEEPPRMLRDRPQGPTRLEREEHERAHEPYRAWCRACVAGRGRADPHHLRDESEKGLPIFGVDYGYLWNRAEEAAGDLGEVAPDEGDPPGGVKTSSPLLGGRWSRDGCAFAHLLQNKGSNERSVAALASELKAGGYRRSIVRSDGEPAIKSNIRDAVLHAMTDSAQEFLTEVVSKGQSPGNGLAEGAIKEVKAKIRTLRQALEEGIGRVVPETHDILAWLVTHAAHTINWYRVGTDGKTPFQRRTGKGFKRVVAPFGQKVLWMEPGKLVSRIESDSRWKEGIFLGVIGGGLGANNYAIGTPEGVKAGRAIKLVPQEECWDSELLLSVKGLPWDRQRRDPTTRIVVPGSSPVAVLPPAPVPAQPPGPRRVYIRRDVEIAKYGQTPGCAGCRAIAAGARPQNHSEECRKRIEQRMRDDEEMARRLGAAAAKRARTEEVPAQAPPAPGPVAQAPAAGGSSSSGAAGSGAHQNVPEEPSRNILRSSGAAPSRDPLPVRMEEDSRGQRRRADEAGMEPLDDLAHSQPVREAIGEIHMLGYLGVERMDFAELFCPGRFAAAAGAFHLTPGSAFDLRTGWDLTEVSGQAECWKALERELPAVVIGSPPCAPFSALQSLNPKSDEWREAMQKGWNHLTFCAAVYRWQSEHDRGFLHEHPWSASSWKTPMISDTMKLPGTRVVRGDQCMFGQSAWHHNEHGWCRRHARKRTGWLTNVPELAEILDVECDASHEHASMIGGTAKPTERYPPELVASILKGIRAYQRRRTGVQINALEAGIGPHVDEEERAADWMNEECETEVEHGKVYKDAYTGVVLDPAAVGEARKQELEFAASLKAWEPRPRSEAFQKMGRAPFGTRWIDCNKGDDESPEHRSRLVVQETRKTSTIPLEDIAATSSSTPPLEVVRLFCSLAMSMPGLVLQFLDVSRAHPHAKVLRDNIYIEPPAELGLPRDQCILLHRCWYGTRDAGQGFEFAVWDHFESKDFEQGCFSACVYRHKAKRLWYFVHGDDYVGLGMETDLEWYRKEVSQRFIIKRTGYLGPAAHHKLEITILNRVLTWRVADAAKGLGEMITYEADQRHADILMRDYGLEPGKSKGKQVPWDKPSYIGKHPLAGPLLTAAASRRFKSSCMRHLFLALDRPDLQFVAKEISRAMASPTVNADETLKGVARYLVQAPRVLWRYPRQPAPSKVVALVDANWAACPVTRKSTGCTHLMFGRHPIFSGSATQTVIALSSGESEFYSAVRGACRLLGMQALMKDLGFDVGAELGTDSSASKGLASRRGAGQVRHIHCPALWLQQAVSRRRLTLAKKPGATLSADIGTKAGIASGKMWDLMQRFGCTRAAGRSSAALAMV